MKCLLINEGNIDKIEKLEAKLRDFYDRSEDYTVFKEMTWKPEFWEVVVEQMEKIDGATGKFLEIGAAKSGFAEYLRKTGRKYDVAFQDITPRCKEHLSKYSSQLYFCPVEEIEPEQFDVVFHSYVFEHVTRPRRFLDSVCRLLRKCGRHVIECPRYDFPLYLPPAIRHISTWSKAEYVMKSFLGSYPEFTIVKEPAVFFRDFRRDYDAVHRVTRASIFKYARQRKLQIEEFGHIEDRSVVAVLKRNMRLRVVLYTP